MSPNRNKYPQPVRLPGLNIIPGTWFSDWNMFLSCSIEIRSGGGAIIDPGSDARQLSAVAERGVQVNINTHHHGDHMRCNLLFETAELWTSQRDATVYGNYPVLLAEYGIRSELAEEWERQLVPSEQQAMELPVARAVAHGERAWIGDVELVFHHAPGHTPGMLCIEFPHQRAMYTADIDLTYFGPWYGQLTSSIDDFIRSARAIAAADVDWYITSHEVGVCSAEAFRRRLPSYLREIDKRDDRLLDRLDRPRTIADLLTGGLVYPPRAIEHPWPRHWERLHIIHHLRRLEERGVVQRQGILERSRNDRAVATERWLRT